MKSSRNPRSGLRRLPPKALTALILLCAGWFAAHAQTAPQPRREQLLNGLRILLVGRPGDQNVLVKLRVHSGAAFDLAGKEGLTATLADAMFDQQTRDYVTEELGGRIEVKTTYDALDITLAGRATDFERLLELARNAVTNPQLTPEVVERVRAARLKSLRDAQPVPAEQADRAVAARLFGTYPYGRTTAGTPESVARFERADFILMRERFLNPDNTTLVIVGGVEPRNVMRTLRESFGAWRKSDRAVPATFRLPDPPDERTLVVGREGAGGVELRLAVRGLARTDRDMPAAQLLAALVRERWLAALPELRDRAAFARHEAYRENGIFRMGATLVTPAETAKALEAARAVLNNLAASAPTAAELESAKRATSFGQSASNDETFAVGWLDEHTYKSTAATAAELARAAAAVTPADAQRVAARLFLHTPVATVALGDAAQLRDELARVNVVEVFGEAAAKPTPAPTPTPGKQQQPALQLKRP
jgi:zinc protease